ncbi:protein CHUP1, chloroplastic-like [Neltuma alba]|uniref:protein CHUP1, chloroplastic-like n=1 Tax=Neltuma alba TaxID=207710 RepID=UPI0010A3CE8A|nr:protein CHUP1, chloroplastic-like [Prosopis alba]
MDNTSSKTELLTPLVLKAGVPLAVLSVAGLVYAWIIAKKSLSTPSLNRPDVSSPETNDSQQGVKPDENSHGLPSKEEHNSASHENNPSLEQEISRLRSQIEDLQKRESDLRLQFDRYCDVKERESLLTQVINLLSVETARVELLEKEISFMEAENRKLECFLVQYVRITQQLDGCKSQNRLLHGRLKKLQRKSKAQSRLTNRQALKIKASETEILENRNALRTSTDVIDQIKNEVRELHSVLEQLQNEKNELLKNLDEAEKSYASKVEALDASKEEYKQLVKEMEELKREREDEVKELIQLRWINACLRHELVKQDGQQKNEGRERMKEKSEGSDGITQYDTDDSVIEQDHQPMPCFGAVPSDGVCSKKNKLLRKVKRWVEGSDKARVSPVGLTEKDGHESHTESQGAEKTPVPA